MAEKHKNLSDKYVYNDMVMIDAFPADVLDRIPHFQNRPDDILIDTYPKAGTTWLQQITWLIMNGADTDTARTVPMNIRSPFIERKVGDDCALDRLQTAPSPRIIKSHLPYSFFQDAIEGERRVPFKIIIGMRNVKDVIVSYYHFYRMNSYLGGDPDLTFDDFFELFRSKKLVHGDYFDHVLSWWTKRSNPNIYFVRYEDMKRDPKEEILKLASFLGKNLSGSQLQAIIQETSFKAMQTNSTVNMDGNPRLDNSISKFIRKGEIGDWANYFSEDQRKYVDDLCESKLAANGLVFSDVPSD